MVFDGNIVDMLSLGVGLLAIAIRPLRRWFLHQKKLFYRDKAIADFLNGATLVPFVFMVVGVFSKEYMNTLINSSKLSIGLAGGVGMLFVLSELSKIK